MTKRAGFTLIETIVALVLLQIAMLALAATTAVAARQLSDTAVRRRAHAVAQSRAEWIRPTACAAPSSGTRGHAGGMVEYWRIEGSGRVRVATDSVSAPLTRGAKAVAVARAWVLCGE